MIGTLAPREPLFTRSTLSRKRSPGPITRGGGLTERTDTSGRRVAANA